MRARKLGPLLAVLVGALALATPARADLFEPIQLLSSGVLAIPGGTGTAQQALYAHDAVVSANGRYVAFDGYVGGYTGVWRRDLVTREIAPVAVGRTVAGTELCEEAPAPCDAEFPSISEDGRYVSFTTAAALEPTLDKNTKPDVYVRDMTASVSLAEMERPSSSSCEQSEEPRACPFTIASAVDGSAAGLTYDEQPGTGAIASARAAISADGGKVAFVTTGTSNLAGTGTPADQVAVRNLQTRETQLVSAELDPATGQATVPAKPVSLAEGSSVLGAVRVSGLFPIHRPYALQSEGGASISADGTTVAWMGTSIYKQARMLPAERPGASYTEPLWRRIADGPAAPTRRITGGSEPENPLCQASGEQQLPEGSVSESDPCQGPFRREVSGLYSPAAAQALPQLSADGYTVAFLATGSLVRLGQNFGHGEGGSTDLYLADMRGGETRNAALRPITEIRSAAYAGAAPITDFAISPDARQLAFSTQRTQFPLGSPSYASQPMATPLMSELFLVDLENDTLTRVTHGFEGGPSERPHKEETSGSDPYKEATDGALSPSFSADDSLLTFSTSASNLVSGDGNTSPPGTATGSADGTDVFLATRVAFKPAPVEGYVSAPPPPPSTSPEWRLDVTASSLRNGRVVLYARVPAAGRLTAAAQSSVAIVRSARAGRRRAHVITVPRTVAAAASNATPNDEGIVQLVLMLRPAYRALAARGGGLTATLAIAFQAANRPALHRRITVTFHTPAPRRARSRTHR